MYEIKYTKNKTGVYFINSLRRNKKRFRIGRAIEIVPIARHKCICLYLGRFEEVLSDSQAIGKILAGLFIMYTSSKSFEEMAELRYQPEDVLKIKNVLIEEISIAIREAITTGKDIVRVKNK